MGAAIQPINLANAVNFCRASIDTASQYGVPDIFMDTLQELMGGAYASAKAGIDVANAGVSKASSIEATSLAPSTSYAANEIRDTTQIG